jgi:dolichol-phosphate mannosyltransferase
MDDKTINKIRGLHGPILVLGASGFLGANLFRNIIGVRRDVFGTARKLPSWRLEGLPEDNIIQSDLLVETNLRGLIHKVKPKTVFNCVAYGAYSFEKNADLIFRTNVNITGMLLEVLSELPVQAYIHAGSSSEYGLACAGPEEDTLPSPNSHYAVSKVATSNLISYYGKLKGLPCANLRIYSVYGPYEDSSRLIPAVVRMGLSGGLPEFVNPEISRDYIYVDDVCNAFYDAALNLKRDAYGESFNIGTGLCTKIREVAEISRNIFGVDKEPEFTMKQRDWDTTDWFSNPSKAKRTLGWTPITSFEDGLRKTAEWYKGLPSAEQYDRSSKQFQLDEKNSVSAIIACYKDEQAIPIMYERLNKVFQKLSVDYEIIFVNDCSPDNSEEVITRLSRQDHKVIGISHSRNFGSQAAFRSGIEVASKNACVLLDGDLQDPPEIIEEFLEKWKEGYDVVYGRRVSRKAPLHMRIAYKLFYRLFNEFSYIKIPLDAGDFSLMNKRVFSALLKFPERDLFIRGLRAFVGFKQTGVDYVRPERMFGQSTNSILKNIGWAKKGFFSFSNFFLNFLSFIGVSLFAVTSALILIQIGSKLLFPQLVPKGITTLLLVNMFFGSMILLSISILGEYIAKIFEEVKRRPHYLRKSIIRDGEVRDAMGEQNIPDNE